MTNIDTRPVIVNIDHYAGDTLTLHVKVAAEVVAGREWKAQVRSRRTSQTPDASFAIYPTAEGADVVLSSADCQRLARRGVYSGVWDVQVAEPDGGDPVTTFAGGDLRIHNDVSRAAT